MIRLSREVRASIGQRRPREPIRNGWAGWPAAVELSPFVIARVTVSGEPHPVTGYLCDIKVLDDLVREMILPTLDDAAGAGGRSLGSLLLGLGERLIRAAPPGTTFEELEIATSPYLRYAVTKENPSMVRLTEQFEFSASHRLHCDALSEEENRRTFGKCNNANGHGHNYVVEVTIEGKPDAKTGLLLPVGTLEERVQEHVIQRFDHKHLNADTAEFGSLNPSVENIAEQVWNLLAERLQPARLARVRVYETPKTWVDFEGR
jgi:6-pyruvoyltetrahydropterin/6-carboxytetrahydropterin synthase